MVLIAQDARLYLVIDRAVRVLRLSFKGIMEEMGQEDLTFGEINTLAYIGENQKSMKDIVTQMAIANSTPTRIMDTLVAKGLVERHTDAEDRRRVLVRLTEKGAELYRDIDHFRNEQVDIAFGDMSEEERHAFMDTLEGIIHNIERKLQGESDVQETN